MKKRHVAIILAAGLSKRFGSQKLLFPIKGIPIIEMTLKPFLLLQELAKIIVVVGDRMGDIKRVLSTYPVTFVYNPLYEKGMASSLKAGLLHIEDEDEVFIHLGDKPFVKTDLLKVMIEEASKKFPHIVVPVHGGVRGHPILVGPGSYLKAISNIDGEEGLRYVIEGEEKNVVHIQADESILMDIDTPDDLKNIERMWEEYEKG